MGIKDVIETVKKPTTLFFDGDYYNGVDELLAACNISRADYTQVKATHRDWDAINVVDFLVKSNKGVLPSKNPSYKAAKEAAAAAKEETVINVLDTPAEEPKESAPESDKSDEEIYIPVTDEETPAEEEAPVEEEAATEEAPAEEEAATEETPAEEVVAETEETVSEEDSKVEEIIEEVESVEETAKEETKEEEPTMNEYDYTQGDSTAKATPAPSGSTAKAFDELLANLNIAKEGYLVVKQVQSDMSELDIVNAILTTKGNPIGETSKDFDELLANLNTPKIGFQLVKQIHSDWSDLDVINAIIKSR